MPLQSAVNAPADVVARLLATAQQCLDGQRPAEALPLLDRLLHLSPIPIGVHETKARTMLALARYPEAESAAQQALDMAPNSATLLQLRARARLARGAYTEALDDAAAAVMADAGCSAATALLADTLLGAGKFDEAIHLNGRALQAMPDDLNAQMRLANSFVLGSRHAAAEELLADIERRAPALAKVAALRAQNALLVGEATQAEHISRAALARGTMDASTHSILAHALLSQGRLAEAKPHFRIAARLAPADAYLAHLAGAAGGETPGRATDAYVTTVFDGYAPRFEAELIGLGYRVPGLIRLAVEKWLAGLATPDAIPGTTLDLGCGTGLVGVALLGLTTAGLEGVDLSQNMLQQAREKGIYTSLRHAEIGTALRDTATLHGLITAGDLFCYFGDLHEVIAGCAARLLPGGRFIFSVEHGSGAPWCLVDTGRYQHATAHVEAALAAAGLVPLALQREVLRVNGDVPVEGLFIVAGKALH